MTNKKFDKIYSLDTNIILDNAMNLVTLADGGKNLIVLPETVLDEIDSKKSGFSEINFQAREFARLLFDAEIKDKKEYNNLTIIETSIGEVTIYIISKEVYKADTDKVSGSIKNDRKILEITKDLQKVNRYKQMKFISLDVMARTRAISIGIPTEALNLGVKDIELDFIKEITLGQGETILDGEDIINFDRDYKPNNFNYIFDEMGQKKLACIQNGKIKLLDEKELRKQNVNPMNKEQLFFSNSLLDNHYNIIVAEAKAGCSLPGSNIDVNLEEYWITKEELSEIINISELAYIRKKGYIKYRKLNNKNFEYDKNSIRYDLLKMLDSKDRANDNRTLNNDKNYTSKYCKLSYWLGFTDFDFALKKVRSIRKYSKFFEDPCIENFTDYNPINFNKVIADIQSQFIQLDKNIILLEDLYNYSNNNTLNYWFFRGWSEEEARDKIENIQSNNGLKYGEKRKKDPEKYNDLYKNQWRYWVKKGYTKEEAKLLVKERQTTFSLDICMQKYGKEGLIVFNERQRKWKKTLNSKTKEELDGINRRKMVSLTKASKSSLKVFSKVIEELKLTNYFIGIEGNREFFISDKTGKIGFYDFTLPDEKLIIEFNGCVWHPKDGQTHWKSIHSDILYEEALYNDRIKIEKAERHGFKVLVIWDDVSVEENVQKCLTFLKEKR
jgi:PhoH-like ATPase